MGWKEPSVGIQDSLGPKGKGPRSEWGRGRDTSETGRRSVRMRSLRKGTEGRVTTATGATHNVSFPEHQTKYKTKWEAQKQSKILEERIVEESRT